ncbi:MAG TPA: aspartate kinase [Blastocatellia bacterium]|nr:aspartate kinase [Blastocatellia bacterium]
MKFGGTSVEDAPSIERVAEIIRARLALRPVVVVSAMGKTTRRLLEASAASASGDTRTTLRIVADLKTRHTSEARWVIGDAAAQVAPRIDQYFDELKKLLEGLAILGEVPPRGLDKILAYGELLSSAIVAAALEERGIRARLLDSRELIKTDDRWGAASPIADLTDSSIVASLGPLVENAEVPVVQGFIGSTREGATTTLGFEGSDYTASIIGAALGVDDIQIWKDVSGLMTADPAVFAAARTVKTCSYAEAGELTYFGAKVLHPKAIGPAARKNIPIHIYNSKLPEATGTEITANVTRCANAIKSIAYTRPVTLIKARYDSDASNAQATSSNDWLRAMLIALGRRRVEPLITAVSASSVALAVESRQLGGHADELVENLSQFGAAGSAAGKAIVTLVGEEMPGDPTVAGRVLKAIEHIRPDAILHGTSPITMNVIVDEGDVEEAIGRLHEEFFDQLDRRVFE